MSVRFISKISFECLFCTQLFLSLTFFLPLVHVVPLFLHTVCVTISLIAANFSYSLFLCAFRFWRISACDRNRLSTEIFIYFIMVFNINSNERQTKRLSRNFGRFFSFYFLSSSRKFMILCIRLKYWTVNVSYVNFADEMGMDKIYENDVNRRQVQRTKEFIEPLSVFTRHHSSSLLCLIYLGIFLSQTTYKYSIQFWWPMVEYSQSCARRFHSYTSFRLAQI